MVAPGPLSTIQDLGRPGLGHLGVGTSGAADPGNLQLANQLVGNEKGFAAIEMTLGRLRLQVNFDAVIAMAGAPCSFTAAGRAGNMNAPMAVSAGDEIRVGAPTVGLRTYLAVRGGIAVPPVLGSRSTDTLSGIGPEMLCAGMVLPIGDDPNGATDGGLVGVFDPAEFASGPILNVVPGPRDDWFTADAWRTLSSALWTVTAEANRIGIRLSGPTLERRVTRELPSEPMVVGALQVPPDGQPILFLADHPVSGGYPVIGVVSRADVHLAAQLRPGRSARFRAT